MYTQESFLQALRTCRDIDTLEKLRLAYLGRHGVINTRLAKIKDLPDHEKKKQGAAINAFKALIERELQQCKETILKKEGAGDWFDPTMPGKKSKKGSLHIVTYAIEEITRIFADLGFIRMSYPEVEWEHFAFEALNMPNNHPARDDFETFYLENTDHKQYGQMILTPHTSSGQVREMLRVKTPPIKMINIGKCYRRNWDLTHTPMFHQFEGLCVNQDLNLTHLKGTIEYFVHEFFGPARKVRFRPFHFQFTEPSFEVDVSCDLCRGTGKIANTSCRVCKSGWLELGGAGMVHRNVLKAGQIDPALYRGWAFGFGVERNFMMKEGLMIADLRILYGGDIRFLEQF